MSKDHAAGDGAVVSFAGHAEARVREHEAGNILEALDDLLARFAQVLRAFLFHHLQIEIQKNKNDSLNIKNIFKSEI